MGFFCADRLSTLACILPQIAQITQRNAAKLHYFAEKDSLSLAFLGGSSSIDRVLLCEYSPADSADHAEECSKAVLFRRERQVDVCVVFELVSFWGFFVIIWEICGRYWGLVCVD